MDSRLKLRRGAPKKTKCGFGFFVVIFIAFAVLLVGLNLSVIVGQSTQLLQTNNQEGGQSLKTLSGENVNALSNVKESQVHVVFSTSCGVKQDWQSYLFFFIAMIQMQQGTVTRIVSGCDPEQEAEMSKIFQEKIAIMNENFYLHFTPEFGKIPGKSFQTTKYWNKPKGMKHWLENKFGYRYEGDISTPYDDDIIVLVDPDMLMQRPFVNDFSHFPNNIWKKYFENRPDTLYHKVTHGHPMAQDYSFGTAWLRAAKENLTHVVGPDSPVHGISSRQDASNFFAAGPPYILTARDMYRVVYHWSLFLPRMFDLFGGFMVEMYGYCMAAAHLDLKHQMARGFMVSNVQMSGGEGWAFLDDVKGDACKISELSETVPHVIHFCQKYSIGDFFLSKYKLPVEFLSCDHPLLEEPPLDIGATANYSHYGNGDIVPWDENESRMIQKYRHTFMVCSIMQALNKAATFYKDHHCPDGANYKKVWNTFRS